MASVVLATQNEKKRMELQVLCAGVARVLSLAEVGLADLEIVEDGDTFHANAEIKARAVMHALQTQGSPFDLLAVVADDSGLCVDALEGAPGVRSARFASDHGRGTGDADNNAWLLQCLAQVRDGERSARFVSVICLLGSDGRQTFCEGSVEGDIARDLVGCGGFGYDPLFLPRASPGRRMAELAPAEKHAISHRGHAMRQAVAQLEAWRHARGV